MPALSVILAAEAPVFELPGVQFTGLAAPSRGSVESSVWIVNIAPGTEGSSHHVTREEVLVVIEGRARVTIADAVHELEAECALIVPAFTEFSVANPYESTFRAVAVLPVGGAAVVNGNSFVPPWAA